MISALRPMAVVAAIGWGALTTDDATAQLFYGWQPTMGYNTTCPPTTPYGYSTGLSWNSGYQFPTQSPTAPIPYRYPAPSSYPGLNYGIPVYSVPAAGGVAAPGYQPAVPGVGYFSVDDRYWEKPSTGSNPSMGIPNRTPIVNSPFYVRPGSIVPVSGTYPADPSRLNSRGGGNAVPGPSLPYVPVMPAPTQDSPFYR